MTTAPYYTAPYYESHHVTRSRKQLDVLPDPGFYRKWEWVDRPGGFSFPCNELGFIDESKLTVEQIKHLRLCETGVVAHKLWDRGVVSGEVENGEAE